MNDAQTSFFVPEDSRADHLELILDVSAIGVWELDVRTGAVWRNLRHDQIFGYEELLPDSSVERFLAHVVPEERDQVVALYRSALENQTDWAFECRILRADGDIRWISATGRPARNKGGSVTRMIGHVLDVTHTKQNEEHLRIVLEELNHRVRNILSVIQAIAIRSFPDHASVAQGRRDFVARIDALAGAHALLGTPNKQTVTLQEIAEQTLRPFRRLGAESGPARFHIEGPRVVIAAKPAVSLALALGELVTNAVKYGALSVPEGRVELVWKLLAPEPESKDPSKQMVELLWCERNGPSIQQDHTAGFGMTLLRQLMPGELNGSVDVDFRPEGLICRMLLTVDRR